MAPALLPNGNLAAGEPPATGRFASLYSEVQNSRLDHALPLPSVIKNPFKIVDGPLSSAAGNPGPSSIYVCVCAYLYVLYLCVVLFIYSID